MDFILHFIYGKQTSVFEASENPIFSFRILQLILLNRFYSYSAHNYIKNALTTFYRQPLSYKTYKPKGLSSISGLPASSVT